MAVMWWTPSSAMALPPGRSFGPRCLRVQQYTANRNPGADPVRGADGAATVDASPREHSMATPTHTASRSERPADAEPLDDRELRAWRGMLRVHATLTKALDAELEAAHGLPLTSYEVLLHLD